MSSFAWMITLVLILTTLGSLVLGFITIRYYWGDRGRPPLTGEERRRQHEEELRLRARQIEWVESHPRELRSLDFLDNRKVSSSKD
jgi:hypothetical protein